MSAWLESQLKEMQKKPVGQPLAEKYTDMMGAKSQIEGWQPSVAPTEALRYGLGFWDLMNQGMETVSMGAIAKEHFDTKDYLSSFKDFKTDISFTDDIKEKYWQEKNYDNIIHEDYKRDMIENSRSPEMMDELVHHYKWKSAKQRYMEKQPWYKQLGYYGAAELTNVPLYLVGGGILRKTAPSTMNLLMGTKRGRALIGAVTEGAMETARDSFGDQDKDTYDYLTAMTLGGIANTVFGHRGSQMDRLFVEQLDKFLGLGSDIKAQLAKTTIRAEREALIKNAITKKRKERGEDDELDGNILAMIQARVDASEGGMIKKGWEAMRFDLAHLTKKSQSDSLSRFAGELFPDATLQGNIPNKQYLVEQRDLIEERMRSLENELFKEPLRRFATEIVGESSTKHMFSSKSNLIFSKMIGSIQKQRSLGTDKTIDELISIEVFEATQRGIVNAKNAAKLASILKDTTNSMTKASERYHEMLADAGNKYFKSFDGEPVIPKDGRYMPLIYDKSKIARLGLTNTQLGKAIAELMQSARKKRGLPPLDREQLVIISRAFAKVISSVDGAKPATTNTLLREILSDKRISKEIKEQLFEEDKIPYQKTKGGSTTRRSLIDYNKEVKIKTKDQEINFKLSDYIRDDYFGAMEQYRRKMSGRTALQKFKWTPKGREIPSVLARRQAMEELGLDPKEEWRTVQRIKDTIGEDKNLVAEISTMVLKSIKNALKDENVDVDAIIGQTSKAIEDGDFDKIPEILKEVGNVLNKPEIANIPTSVLNFLAKRTDELDADTIRVEYSRGNIEAMREDIKARADEIEHEAMNPSSRTLDSEADIDEFVDSIEQELNELVNTGKMSKEEKKAEMSRLLTILRDLKGDPLSKDPFSKYNQAYKVMHLYNIARLLGQTGLSMTAEATTVMWDQGIKTLYETLPQWKSILNQFKTGKIDDELALELEQWIALSTDFTKGMGLYRYDHDYATVGSIDNSTWGKMVNKLEDAGESFAEATLMLGMVKPLTMILEQALTVSTLNKILKVSKGQLKPDENYMKMINELGLNQSMLDRVYKELGKTAVGKDGKISKVNFNKWNPQVRETFIVGLRRRSNNLVQKSRLGDKPGFSSDQEYLLKDTVLGKALFELKDYTMTSYVKQLGRALTRNDAYIYGMIMSQMAALSVAHMAKTHLNYGRQPEKMAKQMELKVVSERTLGMLPASSVLPMLLNGISRATTGGPLLGYDRHNNIVAAGVSSLPTADLIDRLWSTMALPYHAASGDLTGSKVKKTLGALPLSNSFVARPFVEDFSASIE